MEDFPTEKIYPIVRDLGGLVITLLPFYVSF